MKIYTKRGDNGKTDLFGGERVLKNHIRVKAYGEIDLANTAIGFVHSCPGIDPEIKKRLEHIMYLLFCAGSEVATSDKENAQVLLERRLRNRLQGNDVKWLEGIIDEIEANLPPLTNFILPSGAEGAIRLHLARNMVRRAEIALIDLREQGSEIRLEILSFFNRLSDLLFVLARHINISAGVTELVWSGQLLISDEHPGAAD